MNITLYYNAAESIKVDKTSSLTSITSFSGTLKTETSLIAPTILIENNLPDITTIIINSNYAYIDDFKRYYYINDIRAINNRLIEIDMAVDVLMSFKDAIKNLKAFITRNQYLYDVLVKDDIISFNYDKDVNEYEVSKGDKVNYEFNSLTGIVDNNFTISVVNEAEMSFDEITPPSTILPRVAGWVAGANGMSNTYACAPVDITHLAKRLIKNDNLATYILSIMCYPFVVQSSGYDPLMLGDTTLTPTSDTSQDGVYVSLLDKKCSDYMVVADFTITGETFLDYSPYTQYEIYLPYLSWVTLDADLILNKRLLVIYVVDYKTGSAQASIIDDTSSKIIYTSQTQLGIKIPVATTNALEVENNRINNNIGLALGLTSSTLSMVGGVVTGNPVAFAGGIVSGTKNIASYIQNNNTNYTRASGSVGSGNSGVYLPQKVRIRKTRLIPHSYDDNFFEFHGRPLNKTATKLGQLTGFTQVGAVHVHDIKATESEKNSIENLLLNGVIL